MNAILDGALTEKPRYKHRRLLANAMSAIDRLVFDGRVPPTIKQENVISELEIQPHAAGSIAHQQDVSFRIALETIEDALPLFVWNLAVILQRTKLAQSRSQKLQRLNPLGEDNSLAAALGYLGHVRQQAFELGALFGQRIE